MSAPTLGERLAMVMGVTCYHKGRSWALDGICAKCGTPDPENSWADFGAMLEWALQKEEMLWVVILTADSRMNHHEAPTWREWRRVVTEAILEVVEHDAS